MTLANDKCKSQGQQKPLEVAIVCTILQKKGTHPNRVEGGRWQTPSAAPIRGNSTIAGPGSNRVDRDFHVWSRWTNAHPAELSTVWFAARLVGCAECPRHRYRCGPWSFGGLRRGTDPRMIYHCQCDHRCQSVNELRGNWTKLHSN